MKKLICKVLGHKFKYNSKTFASKCTCERCDSKWVTVKNPNYDGTNLLEEDLFIWEKVK